MKTIAFLLICSTGMIWPAVVNTLHSRKSTTVIYKTPGPVITIGKPRVVQWLI